MSEYPPLTASPENAKEHWQELDRLVSLPQVAGVFRDTLGGEDAAAAFERVANTRFVERPASDLQHGFLRASFPEGGAAEIWFNQEGTASNRGVLLERLTASGLSAPEAEAAYEAYLKRAVIHELTHVAMNHEHSPGSTVDAMTMGVGRSVFVGDDHFSVLESLNEAITEKLARKVAIEYFHRASDAEALKWNSPTLSAPDRRPIGAPETDRVIIGAYDKDIEILDTLISIVASEAGASEEDVWKGFVHAACTGGPDDAREALTEALFARNPELLVWYNRYAGSEKPSEEERQAMLDELRSLARLP